MEGIEGDFLKLLPGTEDNELRFVIIYLKFTSEHPSLNVINSVFQPRLDWLWIADSA